MSETGSSAAAETVSRQSTGADRRFALFLLALIFLFFVYLPLTPSLPIEPFDLMVYAPLLFAVYAIGGNRRTFTLALVLAIPSFLLTSLVNLRDPRSTLIAILTFVAIMLFVAYVRWVLIRRVFAEKIVTLHVISEAFCVCICDSAFYERWLARSSKWRHRVRFAYPHLTAHWTWVD